MFINIHGLAALIPTVYNLEVCNTAKETMLCFSESCVFILSFCLFSLPQRDERQDFNTMNPPRLWFHTAAPNQDVFFLPPIPKCTDSVLSVCTSGHKSKGRGGAQRT